MAGSLTLRVITPDHVVLDQSVDSVKIPGVDGLIGVLPRHAAMVAALDVGVLTYVSGSQSGAVFVSGGFAEVRDNTVRVVSEAGEEPSAIDVDRAQESEKRARQRIEEALRPGMADIDLVRAQAALRRSLLRLRASGRR